MEGGCDGGMEEWSRVMVSEGGGRVWKAVVGTHILLLCFCW